MYSAYHGRFGVRERKTASTVVEGRAQIPYLAP
nr:MAG TPA: hypothetical protein [Caudoviricetes sp.]